MTTEGNDRTAFGSTVFSRRQAVQLTGLAGLTLAAAACTDTSGVSNAPARTAAANAFRIPDSSKLPSGTVSMRWTDSGDQKAKFFQPFFNAYHQKHPNITVTYQGTNWPTIQQSITLGLRNGTVPDVFFLPNISTATAVSQKWIGAYDDIVPNWPEVKKRFPPGLFANGVTDFDGKSYAMPLASAARLGTLTLFNEAYTKKAGYDLNGVISWDDFRKMAKAVTKQGAGKYYGLMMYLAGDPGLSVPASVMAQMAGVHGGIDGFNWQTGEYNFTNPISAEAVEFFLAMQSDGSVFPGSVSLNAAGARGRFPQGQAAVIFQGPWNISPWKEGNPDLQLGLNIPPQRDPKDIWPWGHGPGGNLWVYSTKSRYPEVIGDIFAYLCSDIGQVQWASLDGAADPAAFPNAMKTASLDPLSKKSLQINQDHTVLLPEPSVRNPDVEKVYAAQKAIQPNFSDVCTGLFTGQIKDVKKAMKDLQDRSERALNDAITTAKSRGAKVSRDDWVFKDWDPKKSYDKLYA
jgi:multiple sugar transport system substrate-binding protein